MEIQVLGGLSVHLVSHTMQLGTPKQQIVLAMLVTHAEQLVTIEQLVDELWPDGPPRSAVPNVRTYAATLRRTFEAAGTENLVLLKQGDAYRLQIDPSCVDLINFAADHEEARRSAGLDELDRAEELLVRGLARWRGRMLAGLPLGPVLSGHVSAAEEQRLLAVEQLAEVRLRLGRYDRAVPALRGLLAVDPLREPAHLLLMRALHARGDHAGALAAYEAARRALDEHLGVRPGAELQKVRQLVRAGASGATADASVVSVAEEARHGAPRASSSETLGDPGPSPAVDWLPKPVPEFVGRTDIVSRLLTETRRSEQQGCPVHVVEGMAGIGKTTMAVHVARLLAERYQDAALFVDLRGQGGEEPVSAAVALVTLLRQLGIPVGQIPAEFDYRIEMWRRELEKRRSVVVLDNAANAEQVLPLLPAAPGTVVIVTSRRRLSGVGDRPPHLLPVLAPWEGLALLAASVGASRVTAEPEAAAAVVRRCGHLPLAIKLAASRLAHRPTWKVDDLARLLESSARGLGHLALGNRNLPGVFATSYDALSTTTRRLFRQMSLHPTGRVSPLAVAALTGMSIEMASAALSELADLHLVEEVEPRRYQMHDLIRQFSWDLSLRDDSAEERDYALDGLLDAMLHASLRAAQSVEPSFIRTQVRLGLPYRPDLLETLDDSPVDWFEKERHNLVALVALAVQRGRNQQAWRLARLLWRFLYIRAYFDDIISTQTHGLVAARAIGDQRATAMMHNYLASAHLRMSEYHSCLEHLAAAVAIAESLGDRPSIDRYRANMVAVYWLRGDLSQAVETGFHGLRASRHFDSDEIPAFLPNLGLALMTAGRYEEALRMHRLHLFHGRQHRNLFHILNALGHIGAVKCRMGAHVHAVRLLSAALALRDRTGHRYAEPEVRNDLGIALRHVGSIHEAIEQHETALKMAVECGERHVEAAVLNDLALTLARATRADQALELHRSALRMATRIAHPYEQGRALAGLAEHAVAKDPDEARRYWERALTIFRRMSVPERFEVERRLAEVAGEAARPR